MGLHDFVSGDVLTDTQMDEIARQATIICTSSTRPSSPITGMRVYETDTDFVRCWNGAAWRTLPSGVLNRTTSTASTGPFGTTEVVVNGSGCTFTSYGSTQVYRYSWRFTLTSASTGSVNAFVRKDSVHFENAYPYTMGYAGGGETCTGFTVFSVVSGTYDMSMSIQQTAGASTCDIATGGFFALEHLGTL